MENSVGRRHLRALYKPKNTLFALDETAFFCYTISLMTIAMIGQKGLPARSGGVETHVESLAKGLVRRGHSVLVYGRSWYVGTKEASLFEGVEHRITSGIHTKHLDAITHSLTALFDACREEIDIVHVQGTGIAILLPFLRLVFPRTKLVVTIHAMDYRLDKWGWFAKTIFHLGEWLACAFADEVLTVSQELARHCFDAYGRRAVYTSHVFTPRSFAVASTQKARVEALGLIPGQYLLYVGRLIPSKGADRFLEAYAWAKARYPEVFARVQAVVVGGSSFTDAYAKQIQSLAQEIEGAVLVGERIGQELCAIQGQALCHVFPSTQEGLSLAVLEAAFTARPVILHELLGNREVCGDYANMVDASSREELGTALVRLVSMDESERCAQGEAMAHVVRAQYQGTRNIDTMDRLYKGLIHADDRLTTPISGVVERKPA